MRAKMVTVMRRHAQDEVNQEDSEQNEVDGMKKGAESRAAARKPRDAAAALIGLKFAMHSL